MTPLSLLFSCNPCDFSELSSHMKGEILVMISNPNQPCSNDLWYLIHCQARKEIYTANVLRSSLDLQSYIPVYKKYSHGHAYALPLFPGYIFVQANLQKVPLSQINTSSGVFSLVEFGGDPQPVPNSVKAAGDAGDPAATR